EVTKALKDSGQLKHYENGKAAGENSYNQEGK
ncbi:cytochrome c biogenesis protein CcmE, partial [Pseudomonas aeruginosa]|nr:cytochrome c biogenesis protein CcmE [Pseudomonas aeruginosa]